MHEFYRCLKFPAQVDKADTKDFAAVASAVVDVYLLQIFPNMGTKRIFMSTSSEGERTAMALLESWDNGWFACNMDFSTRIQPLPGCCMILASYQLPEEKFGDKDSTGNENSLFLNFSKISVLFLGHHVTTDCNQSRFVSSLSSLLWYNWHDTRIKQQPRRDVNHTLSGDSTNEIVVRSSLDDVDIFFSSYPSLDVTKLREGEGNVDVERKQNTDKKPICI